MPSIASSIPRLNNRPTLTRLYRNNLLPPTPPSPSPSLSPQPYTSPHAPSQPLNDLISLYHGDITLLPTTFTVNAAAPHLLGGGGVDGAIHRAAGPSLLAECATLNGCQRGQAKLTHAYDLPSSFVIHTVGPIYDPSIPERVAELLADCYRSSLALVERTELPALPTGLGEVASKSVAFPSISTGAFGYPLREAAEVAVGTVRRWLDERGGSGGMQGWARIVFCVFSERDEAVYREVLPKYFPPTQADLDAAAAKRNGSAIGP